MKKIILSKSFTREHSLFYIYVWKNSDLEVYNLKNVLFIKEENSNKVSVWYDNQELNDTVKMLAIKLNDSEEYFNKIKDTFHECWNFLSPYLKKEKEIEDIKRLKEFYNKLTKWWSAMALVIAAPDMGDLKKDIKNELLKMRSETEKYMDNSDGVFIDFFKKNYPEYKDIIYIISPDELFKLEEEKLSAKEIDLIKKRKSGYALLNNDLFLINELQKKLNEKEISLEQNKMEEDIKEIEGTSASFGVAIGKVRLVKYKKEIKEVEKGEILVTEMTSPDFVVALEKIAAIITDEGGITCHAAIVSREMNIPCIVGTSIATQVLKTGDWVRVNANKGIVTILERAK